MLTSSIYSAFPQSNQAFDQPGHLLALQAKPAVQPVWAIDSRSAQKKIRATADRRLGYFVFFDGRSQLVRLRRNESDDTAAGVRGGEERCNSGQTAKSAQSTTTTAAESAAAAATATVGERSAS